MTHRMHGIQQCYTSSRHLSRQIRTIATRTQETPMRREKEKDRSAHLRCIFAFFLSRPRSATLGFLGALRSRLRFLTFWLLAMSTSHIG